MPEKDFILAGPQYPAQIVWPENVRRIVHLEPEFHSYFYCSSLFTLNLTRDEMVKAGYSPSVRIFEAAGCGTAIISDAWPGLESFFRINEEILLASSSADVISFLKMDQHKAMKIGRRAQERVLAEHSAARRALDFEQIVGSKSPVGQSA
jgi:spore maturation protein CgeB